MTQYELNFSLLVDQMLSKIKDPTYRQLIVEVWTDTTVDVDHHVDDDGKWGDGYHEKVTLCLQTIVIVDSILSRNPELSFQKPIELDLVCHRFNEFNRLRPAF